MSSSDSAENRIDEFLDGLMTQQEAADFLQTVNADEHQQATELQGEIDESLKRMMSGLSVDEKEIEDQFLRAQGTKIETVVDTGRPARYMMPQRLAAVAALLLVALGLGIWFSSGSNQVDIITKARPLVEVYGEKVAAGFKPYYICEDEQRFASTFNKKLGQALALAPMPGGRSMTGISYLGGMSRNTIAMLCEVEGNKVVVFVDREGQPDIELATTSNSPDLNVFVERKFGLVFAEVTPLESAKIIEFFQPAE